GDMSSPQHLACLDARPVGNEYAIRMMCTDGVVTLLNGRELVFHRDEAEVPQNQQQIGCLCHGLARKDVLTFVYLGDDPLAALRVLEGLQVPDQLLAEAVVFRRGNTCLAGLAGNADGDSVARGCSAVGRCLVPVEVSEVTVVAALTRFTRRQILPVHIPFFGQVRVDPDDLGRGGKTVVGSEEDLSLRTGGGD